MYRINFHASPINEDYCEILQQFKYEFINYVDKLYYAEYRCAEIYERLQ